MKSLIWLLDLLGLRVGHPSAPPTGISLHGRVTRDEVEALADGVLPAERCAKVEAVVATSPDLARLLAVQVAVAVT
jgi:hypothetical protein